MASFARTWNLVTHDWFFIYIYQDIYIVCSAPYYLIVYPNCLFSFTADSGSPSRRNRFCCSHIGYLSRICGMGLSKNILSDTNGMVSWIWKCVYILFQFNRSNVLLVLLRFIFPHAQGSKWNIIQLTLLPVYLSGLPCLYAIAMSAQHSSHVQ